MMTLINKEKMLCGLPIEMSEDVAIIKPKTLKDIAIVGSGVFYHYLNLLTLDKKEVEKMFDDKTATPFLFLVANSLASEEFEKKLCDAFSFFLDEAVSFFPEIKCFMIGDFQNMRIIQEENFLEFQEIIRQQNWMTSKQEEVKSDAITEGIKEKIRKGQEKINGLRKNEDENSIELADLIGSLPVSNIGVNIFNVWDMNFYAFNDQFKRMKALKEYEVGLQSLMAGADPKKVKLKDWIQNVQSNK